MRRLIVAGCLLIPVLCWPSAFAQVVHLSDISSRQWTACAAGSVAGGLLANKAGSLLGKKLSKTENLVVTGAGALAGCAIAAKFTEADKRKIEANEQAAITSGHSSTTWTNSEGQPTSASSEAKPVTVAEAPESICKAVTTEFTIAGSGDKSVSKQVYCEDKDGGYKEAGLVL